jgi:hypothetical protein
MRLIRLLCSAFVAAAFPLAAHAQGYSLCTDLSDLLNLAPQGFATAANDALAGAECALLPHADNPSFRCIWKLSKNDEKPGTIWFAKRVQLCVPDWKYSPDYDNPKSPGAVFDSNNLEITVSGLGGGEVAVTVIALKP